MSALAKVITKILPALKVEPSDAQNVLDYSIPEDFRKLWNFQGLPVDRILIIWARTAPDPDLAPINAADCLSPLDWAAAYVKHLAVDSVKWPEILILDATPEAHRKVPTLAHFHTLRPDQLPWLTVSSSPSLNDILEWCAKPKPSSESHAHYNSHCKAALDRFLREIRINLTEVNSEEKADRHAISNIVGPLMLLPETLETTLHSHALREVMRACAMLHARITEEMDIPKLHGLNIYLLDDQVDHGWSNWVESRLEASSFLLSSDSPVALVETLSGKKAPDFRFLLGSAAFARSEAPKSNIPVMLLDLRLFSGQQAEEYAYYKYLLLPIITENFLVSHDRNLPWSGFDDSLGSSFSNARSLLEADNPIIAESPEHHEMLTWLPRVLSLVDLALPIVIFSSTGRRGISEAFAPYGNIITFFEKPRFFGEDISLVRQRTELAFNEALGRAREIGSAAFKIAEIQSLELVQYQAACKALGDKKHLEIYHDESSDPTEEKFRVALFAVGFPTLNDAEEANETIRINGPVFFGPNSLNKETELGRQKTQWKNEIVIPLKNALNQHNVNDDSFIPFIVISGDPITTKPAKNPLALLDPSGLDNVNQELLRLISEVALCDVLPWIAPKIESVHFYGATRQRAVQKAVGLTARKLEAELHRQWMINVNVSEGTDWLMRREQLLWPSLRRDSFCGLLNELFTGRSKSKKGWAFGQKVSKAFGTSLPNQNTNGAPIGYRYLHSIADIVARVTDYDPLRWKTLENNPDFPITLRGVAAWKCRIVRILNCHRALDEGDLVDGFGYGMGVDHSHDIAGNVVAFRLTEYISNMTGPDFIKIVKHFTNGGPNWTHSPRLHAKEKARPVPSDQPIPIAPPAARTSSVSKSGLIEQYLVKKIGHFTCYSGRWHDRGSEGFQVRISSTENVNVFVRIVDSNPDTLKGLQDMGFITPENTHFTDKGGLCGKPWKPSPGTRSSGW